MIKLGTEQSEALLRMEKFLEDDEQCLVLTGSAGVGKTFILKEYLQYLESIGVNFVLCAPTHKAKSVLEEVTGYSAITVHKLLSLSPNIEIFNLDFRELEFKSLGLDIIPIQGLIIIDECSMITSALYDLIIKYATKHNSKVLFIGDECQLQGVNEGCISKVFEHTNRIKLTKIYRQVETNGLLPLLTKLRNTPIKSFEPILKPEGSLYIYNKPKDFMLVALEYFKEGIKHQDTSSVKLLAYTNARVKGLNECMRKLLWNDSEEYHQFEFLTGYENFEYNKDQFYNSQDYIITNKPKKRDKLIPNFLKLPGYDLELYDKVDKLLLNVFILDRTINDDYISSLATRIEDIRMTALELKQAGKKQKAAIMWKSYFQMMKSFATPEHLMFDNRIIKKKTFDYGYACSTHKSQGSSLDTVFIDMSNIMNCKNKDELRQLQYVSLSRTKTDAHILI